jgi:hypothetical protein
MKCWTIGRAMGSASMLACMLACMVMTGVMPATAQTVRPADEQAQREEAEAWPTGEGTGPYPALMETDPSAPNHVIYRPKDLEGLGKRKLGILAWGNGGCRDNGAAARHHLVEIASWGYVVVAPGRILSGPTATERPTQRTIGADGKMPPVATTPGDVRAGIDWAIGENSRKASRYRSHIDTKAVAVGGHSCGGLQALRVGSDPRVKTVMVHNSGTFPPNTNPIVGMQIEKEDLKAIHTPIIYFLGGAADIAYPQGTDDFRIINHVPIAMVNMPVGHGGTFWQRHGGSVAHAALDWMDWQLRGDRSAARTFLGENCRLCTVKGWTVDRKNLR